MKKSMLSILLFSTILSAESFTFTKYLKVSKSKPQYERINQRVPYQECYDKRVRVDRAYNSYDNGSYNDNDKVAASVLGGAIGGVIGHQIGKGKGNDIATVGGAILGTIVGGNMATQNREPQPVYQEPSYQIKRECITKYRDTGVKSRLVGYENFAYYNGRKIVKFSDERLSTIPVTITVEY